MDQGYRTALLDWLACAAAGRAESAARAARTAGDGLLERVAAAATAGHVLDFDDTYLPGLAHLSAPAAPAALVLGADLGATVGEALAAYAAGFEAMGAPAAASHPALYERGWHPTAVCGTVGAAAAASRLLGLDPQRTEMASALALLGAGGLRSAFGSDGKSLQVGMAAAQGVHAARLAAGGATVSRRVFEGPDGFGMAFGGRWAKPRGAPAIRENWIKAYPCCLQAHGAIEAAAAVRANGGTPAGAIAVTVHPVSRQAAAFDDVANGLEAKFSIPYLTAFTLLHGPPGLADFAGVNAAAQALAAERVAVLTDATLLESEAVLSVDGEERARVEAALGSPRRPLDGVRLAAKVRDLAGTSLDGALDDAGRAAADVLAAAGL